MRLIDAHALKEKAVPLLFPTKMEPCGHIPIPVQAVVVAEIEQAPTIEVEPVRHGRWVGLEYDGYADGFPVYDLWECSECGKEVRGEDVPDTHPYCHGCGAKMDGDEHEA